MPGGARLGHALGHLLCQARVERGDRLGLANPDLAKLGLEGLAKLLREADPVEAPHELVKVELAVRRRARFLHAVQVFLGYSHFYLIKMDS